MQTWTLFLEKLPVTLDNLSAKTNQETTLHFQISDSIGDMEIEHPSSDIRSARQCVAASILALCQIFK